MASWCQPRPPLKPTDHLERGCGLVKRIHVALSGGEDLPGLHGDVVELLAKGSGQRARPAAALPARCTETVMSS
jgi:hypothetical protein